MRRLTIVFTVFSISLFCSCLKYPDSNYSPTEPIYNPNVYIDLTDQTLSTVLQHACGNWKLRYHSMTGATYNANSEEELLIRYDSIFFSLNRYLLFGAPVEWKRGSYFMTGKPMYSMKFQRPDGNVDSLSVVSITEGRLELMDGQVAGLKHLYDKGPIIPDK